MDTLAYSYVYKMEGSIVGLDWSVNMLKLKKYGDVQTLVNWRFEIDPVEDGNEEGVIDKKKWWFCGVCQLIKTQFATILSFSILSSSGFVNGLGLKKNQF